MAPLTGDSQRHHSVHQPKLLPLPVKAGAAIWTSGIVCSNAAGLAVAGSDTANLRAHGIAWRGYDNTNGSDGTLGAAFTQIGAARVCEVDGQGEWELAFTGATPTPGAPAFIVDDNTVSTVTTNSIKIGEFTRPGSAGTWFVDVSRR
jgi:hypothetical protein